MQFNIFRNFITTTVILLNIQNIYSADPNPPTDKSSRSSSSSPARKRDHLVQLITFESSTSFEDKGNNKFSLYIYNVDKQAKAQLENLVLVQLGLFNDLLVTFDDPRRFPDPSTWLTVGIFTCKHNQLVMLRFKVKEKGDEHHYYYSLRPTTKTLKNCPIDSLEEKEETDSDGLIRHPVPKDCDNKCYSEKIDSEWGNLFDNVCKPHKRTKQKLKNPLFKLVVVTTNKKVDKKKFKLRNESKTKESSKWKRTDSDLVRLYPFYDYTHLEYPRFSLFTYQLDKEDQKKMKFPVFFDFFVFNNKLLECDFDVIFPDLENCTHIVVYSCQHNHPVMVVFIVKTGGGSYRYYYKLDGTSLTLKNTDVPFLSQEPETEKDTKLIRYLVQRNNGDQNIHETISYNWNDMFGDVCKDHKQGDITFSTLDESLSICFTHCVKKQKRSWCTRLFCCICCCCSCSKCCRK